ncbi:TBC domain-containing protein kinase-like protein [Choanephora cucurbitarum]|uniref:TBC domain-containing protein kinase-like protein n=1 Tax=Choanephora cucurbitarum TaxID=101091 RepID=A0A1C7NM92_9FUNG|nr:TBC domain-containing protein kinase-like protein [Choanephora cucurbitarum]
MALFAQAIELKVQKDKSIPKLASVNFVGSSRVSEALAVSGHLALSAPSQIIGRFQYLKTLHHPNLCSYVEIHRGKYDRLFIVSEYHDSSLQRAKNLESSQPPPIHVSVLKQWAFEIVSALKYLDDHGIIHASLSPTNILLDKENHIQLFGYGLHYMTDGGKYVDFPLGYPIYLAPECLGQHEADGIKDDKRDIWALAIVLLEQYTRNSFWTTSDVGLIFESLWNLYEWQDEDVDIWHHPEIGSLDINQVVLQFLQNEQTDPEVEAFRQFILACLQVSVETRYGILDALSSSFFDQGLVSNHATQWVKGPILASDDIDIDALEIQTEEKADAEDVQQMLQTLPASHIYNLWKLAGGDVELDLVKRGVFLSTPIIKQLPRVCIMPDGSEIGDKVTDTAQLYSDAVYMLGYKELFQRLREGKKKVANDRFEWDTDYFKLVDENDVNFLLDDNTYDDCDSTFHESDSEGHPSTSDNDMVFLDETVTVASPQSEFINIPSPSSLRSFSNSRNSFTNMMGRSRSASSLSVNSNASIPVQQDQEQQYQEQQTNHKLPLLLREQDINYQYYRQTLFSELLRQYPASRKEIIHHAKIDIPPLLRGKVWAALLGVRGPLGHDYDQINKYVDMGSDRQIDVDVPRCHQYNQLLASSTGHEKLRRLLKAWVYENKNLVYWQGLDSLCAPFLTLHFNDEAIAFACLQKFIPKFLNNFFLSDNAPVLQEYLAVFRHLLSFHDPELSSHLDTIGFMPDLYAIPWFLTMFTHVFPLDKIYHLWDKLLVGPTSLPLFAGIAILRQIRDTLLGYEFNDCIVLFSDSFPKVDIEKCVQSALSMCKVTPPSITVRIHSPDSTTSKSKSWWEEPIPVEIKKMELAPRLNIQDVHKILAYALVLDIRSESEFVDGHIPSSINVLTTQLTSYANILKKLNRKYHLVVSQPDQGSEYTAELVRKHLARVALLQGGIEAFEAHLDSHIPLCHCRPQKQTTQGFKGKGSEPPFVMWRCKVPTPLKKK